MLQQRYRAVIVLDIGCVHLHGKQRSACVRDNMAFASLHFLTRIKPAWAATFRRFHSLAVDHTGRGRALASFCLARALDQNTIDPPSAKPIMHGYSSGKGFFSAGRQGLGTQVMCMLVLKGCSPIEK